MQCDKLISDIFRWLRFPLIVGVVFIHCFGTPIDVQTIDFTHLAGRDVYDLLRIALSNVLPRVCVPLFFFMSGYLFFTKLDTWNWGVYAGKLKKRARTVLAPYLLWITIAILYRCAVLLVKGDGWQSLVSFFSEYGYWHLYWNCFELDPVRLSWTGMEVHSTTPFHYALWYLRDLMVMMLLAPCFYWFFKHLKIWGLLLLMVNYVSNIAAFVPELLPTPLLFFGAGAYFKIYRIDAAHCFRPYRIVMYIATLLLAVLCVRYNSFLTYTGNLFFPFFVVFGSISAFCIAAYVVENRRFNIMQKLSGASFFVYLAHIVAFTPLTFFAVKKFIGPANALLMSIGYVATPFIIIAECLVVYALLRHFLPKVSQLLTGGR